MPHGRSRRPLPALPQLFPVILLLLLFLPAPAARPAPARPLPASDQAVILLAAGPDALQVQAADGRAFSIKITRATWVLRRGLVAAPRDLLPGETLRVRLGRGQAGTPTALLVCDAETAEAIESHRGRPLTGTVVGADGLVWAVQPEGGEVPLPVCLSARTTFRAGGAAVSASAFGAGAQVLITTRGLANGLLSALSVSDAPEDAGSKDLRGGAAAVDAGRADAPRSVSGVIVEARPDLGLLTLLETAGGLQTVAVAPGTRITSSGRAARLEEMAAGMRVRVWRGARQDAAGHFVAARVSASAAGPAGKKRRNPSR